MRAGIGTQLLWDDHEFVVIAVDYRHALLLDATEDDIAKPGSDRLIDAVVAHGDANAVAARLPQHLEAGADPVATPCSCPGRRGRSRSRRAPPPSASPWR